jgi:hypothetical protein
MTRLITAIASLLVPLVAVLVSYAAWRGQLPPELASHWSGAGPADEVMPVGAMLAAALVMTGLPAVAGAVAGFWRGASASSRRLVFLVAGIVAGAGAAIWLLSAALTLQAGDPREAVLGGWVVLALAGAAYGLVPFLLAPKPQVDAPRDVKARIDLAPGEGGAWSRTVTAKLFLWGVVVVVGVGVAIAIPAAAGGELPDAIVAFAVLAVAVVVLAALSRFRVTADWRGLRVVSSLFGVTVKRIPLEDIDTLEVGELVPTDWGGWGYRIMPGRSALVLRRGPGLIVTTKGRKQFAVTLDDPEVPAALLATLRDSARA